MGAAAFSQATRSALGVALSGGDVSSGLVVHRFCFVGVEGMVMDDWVTGIRWKDVVMCKISVYSAGWFLSSQRWCGVVTGACDVRRVGLPLTRLTSVTSEQPELGRRQIPYSGHCDKVVSAREIAFDRLIALKLMVRLDKQLDSIVRWRVIYSIVDSAEYSQATKLMHSIHDSA